MRDHITRVRDRRVAAVLAAAAAPAERPVPGEAAALAEFRAAMSVAPAPTRSPMHSRTTAKIVAASALSVFSLVGGGYAVAATGALPGTAQQTARDALARVGVTVPGPADQAAEATTARGGAEPTATAAADESTASAHGAAVSELATTTELEGDDKGAAISGLASDGRSKAGAHPTPTATASATAEAEDDTAVDGREKGDEASGGAAGAGADNADTHRP